MKLETLKKGFVYHIYNRGINGENIFSNDENKKYFLKLLNKYLVENVSIFAYCLMDNHFHLVIRVENDDAIVTQAFSNFFNAYAKAYNKLKSRTGSLFEKHFKRICIETEDYLRKLIIYVHLNPKHHFDLDFVDYRFCSYEAYLSSKETKISKNEILILFGDIENFKFVHNEKSNLLEEKYTLE